mgnify:CR=1 FL=1
MVNGFLGFSTFRAAPLFNIHDVTVRPEARRRGVARRLLNEVIQWARGHGCCRVTLEVRSDNTPASELYRSLGFGDSAPVGVRYEFLTLHLTEGPA